MIYIYIYIYSIRTETINLLYFTVKPNIFLDLRSPTLLVSSPDYTTCITDINTIQFGDKIQNNI